MPADARQDRQKNLSEARKTTLAALTRVDPQTLLNLSHLTLPQIQEIQEEIAKLLPAGNLPALILSGLLQIKTRRLTQKRVQRDLKALSQGVNLLPQSLYGFFVAGPAVVLYVYHQLLTLAGKDIEDAFPQGIWQFYLEFGLREDSARHANETLGFHRVVSSDAGSTRAAAAWVLSAAKILHRYDDLLAVDWRERMFLRTFHEVTAEDETVETHSLGSLARAWDHKRPYHAPSPEIDYLRYRLETFERFLQPLFELLPEGVQARIRKRYAERQQARMAPYQEQMSLLAALTPTAHREEKTLLPLWRAAIGLIWQGQTYLLPAADRDADGRVLCVPPGPDAGTIPLAATEGRLRDPQGRLLAVDRAGRVHLAESDAYLGTLRPPSPERVLAWVEAILARSGDTLAPTLDVRLAEIPRAEQPRVRDGLPTSAKEALAEVRRAPILINWDVHASQRPLALLRRDHRGIGDHALTLFWTDRSMIFDQSHIFFDGLWGMTVAEIMTDAAVHTYRRLGDVQASVRTPESTHLDLTVSVKTLNQLRTRCVDREATAESTGVKMRQLSQLRRWLQQRGVRLTVNALLLLYRAFHAASYTLSAEVRQALSALHTRLDVETAATIETSVEKTLTHLCETNPALLIPMDASYVSPRARLYPTTFRNPIGQILGLFTETQKQYLTYRQSSSTANWEAFDTSRRELLAHLQAFGDVLKALKQVTMRGESFSTATLQLLGHLPPAMQHLLDVIPQRISVLNEVIKGSEVFSNVGRVAHHSTLHRFISAKDDGKAKILVWGVLTDDQNVMHLSLRDFRPFVTRMLEAGEDDLAQRLAQDYLDTYVQGFNRFVKTLGAFVAAGRDSSNVS